MVKSLGSGRVSRSVNQDSWREYFDKITSGMAREASNKQRCLNIDYIHAITYSLLVSLMKGLVIVIISDRLILCLICAFQIIVQHE